MYVAFILCSILGFGKLDADTIHGALYGFVLPWRWVTSYSDLSIYLQVGWVAVVQETEVD